MEIQLKVVKDEGQIYPKYFSINKPRKLLS